MMSEKYHYESGAIHHDHHKEINIGSVSEKALKDIISKFFKDDAEDAEILGEVEADAEPQTSNNEVEPVTIDSVIAATICQMDEEGDLKRKGDWGLLMIAMNQSDDMPNFDTPRSYVDYLSKMLKLKGVPSESSISKMMAKTRGMFPNWTFADTNDTVETTRRINVGKMFISAVRKKK